MVFALILVIALVAGIITGRHIDLDISLLADVMLYTMLFFIGMEMAQKREELVRDFTEVGVLAILLPIATIMGSMAGGAIAGLLLPGITFGTGMTIASGCGWYSLTGPYLAKFNPEYGLIGFLANFMREITMLIFYPLLFKWLDPIAAVTIGGATTMDSTLPLVRKFAGRKAGIVAFAHGFVISLIVPLLLMLETGMFF